MFWEGVWEGFGKGFGRGFGMGFGRVFERGFGKRLGGEEAEVAFVLQFTIETWHGPSGVW